MKSFNPRTHKGCDRYQCYLMFHQGSFNPRTHKGCDQDGRVLQTAEVVSIHAPTKGATPLRVSLLYLFCGFNPRTHKGCDLATIISLRLQKSFNPRTHKGCDERTANSSLPKNRFQSTHPQRVRLRIPYNNNPMSCFNPRTHKGCDSISICFTTIFFCFNPRTHKGCDR